MNKQSKVNLYKKLYDNEKNYLRNLLPMYNTINSCVNFNIDTFLDYGCGKSNLCEIFKSAYLINLLKLISLLIAMLWSIFPKQK